MSHTSDSRYLARENMANSDPVIIPYMIITTSQ